MEEDPYIFWIIAKLAGVPRPIPINTYQFPFVLKIYFRLLLCGLYMPSIDPDAQHTAR